MLFDAAAELLKESSTIYVFGYTLITSHDVLTAASLDEAAVRARNIKALDLQDGLTPIGHQSRAAQKRRSPILAAITMHRVRGRVTIGSELSFRIGTPHPCYPQSWSVRTEPLAPTSQLPALPMSSIPATLWPGTFSLGDDDLDTEFEIQSPLGRTLAAMALAKYASNRPWRLIAINFALPAHLATLGTRHWRAIDKAGHWANYVTAIDRLFQDLHSHPPPIDYERRRITAQPQAIASQARVAAADHPDRQIATSDFALSLWGAYTGTHAGYAPAELAEDDDHSSTFASLFDRYATALGKPAAEPLTWRPP